MPITVECSCGKRFQVADDRAGHKVRCAVCQEIVPIPGRAEEAEAGYAVEDMRKCPKCKRKWPGETVLCVACGYNFQTGRAVERTYDIVNRIIDVGARWLGIYTRLHFFRGRKGEAVLTISKKFLFIPAGTRTIDLGDYNAVLTDCALGSTGEDSAPDVYYLYLEGPRQRTTRILRTTSEWKMHEVVDTLKELADLTIKRR
jgi:hypothetical protein